MNRARLAWGATRNMLRAAKNDPAWAIVAVITTPLRGGRHMIKAAILFAIVVLSSGYGMRKLMQVAGLEQGDALWLVGYGLFSIFAVIVLLRLITTPLIAAFSDRDGDTHGSARFATAKEIAPLMRDAGGLLIGRDGRSGRLLRYSGPAHLLTMAPTRTGKGVGTIIPNLLTADRSVLCIDPKGENTKITRRARTMFGPVHVLDPFGISGQPSSAFNPFSGLDPRNLDVAEDAATLADALVYDEPGMAGEAHWNEEAKALIGGLILAIVAEEPGTRRTLSTLREYLTLPADRFAVLLTRMQNSPAAAGLIARAANRHLAKSDREAAGVLSSAQRHTHFLDSPRMSAVLARSDFQFADLKAATATVFLVLPPDRLATYSRWLRLLVTQSLTEMARTHATSSTQKPVLYLLDEFAVLGHLASVERAMGLMAGYGVQLWPILQDIHQLKATYGQRAGTFLSNAGVLQVFGVNDHDSARLISDLLGQGTVVFQAIGRALDSDRSGISYSEQHVGRSLMTPDEVRALPQRAQLLFLAGQRPIIATKLRYFADREFAGRFDTA